MALVAIQCQNCGGSLQVDSEAKNYYCPHCQTSYAMEQTVNQTFQTTNIGHIETANIIDDGSGKIDQEIYSGEAKLQLGRYEEAREDFWELTKQYAHKYRTWLGLARAITREFKVEPSGKREFDVVKDALNNALQLAPAEEKGQIEETKTAYCTKWEAYEEQLNQTRFQRMENIDNRLCATLGPKRQQLSEVRATVAKKRELLSKVEQLKERVPIIGGAVIGIIVLLGMLSTDTGTIGSIFSAAGIALVVYFVLKFAFAIVNKVIAVPTELLIKSSNDRISKMECEIQGLENQFENERCEVIVQTRWLDN